MSSISVLTPVFGSYRYSPAFKKDYNKETNNNDLIVPKNQNNYNDLLGIENELNSIITQVGGNKSGGGISNDIAFTKAKIKELEISTKDAWSNCPNVLKEKLAALNSLNDKLTALDIQYGDLNETMENDKGGIILPEKKKLVTNPLEITAAYNKLLVNKPAQTQNIYKSAKDFSADGIEKSLQTLDKNNWDYKKFNAQDAKLYQSMKDTVLIGDAKTAAKEQITTIDEKLKDLNENGFELYPNTNLKVYSAKTTGKILALESAKLRREALTKPIINAEVDQNLTKPDIMIQPTSVGKNLIFKINEQFTPTDFEVNETIENNKAYKPVIEKLFPDGLPLHIVPGYLNEKFGDMSGGETMPNDPDAGVWLNSYDYNKKYDYMSTLERTIAASRGLNDFTPSVSRGKEDRSRALAHEIGHVLSYKIMQNENNNQNSANSGLLLSADIPFQSGWEGIRMEAKQHLNGNEMSSRQLKHLESDEVDNIRNFVNYEMLAEDIRLAVNGEKIPASSRMSGIYDQSEEGKEQYQKALNYVRNCLVEGKSPAEELFS